MHNYPSDLAELVSQRWGNPCSPQDRQILAIEDSVCTEELPPADVLEKLLSICYQASLLREEERQVRFRLILRDPELFSAEEGPPDGLHRLILKHPLPCNERELRKLSPSTDFYGSLIGVRLRTDGELEIWGMIHSGPRWAQSLFGGGKTFHPLPSSLVIHVMNPGRMTVCNGSVVIGTLSSGDIIFPSMGVFDSTWMRKQFAIARSEEYALHLEEGRKNLAPWAVVDVEFFRMMKKQVILRLIGKIKAARHGGTVITIPDSHITRMASRIPNILFKYRFSPEEPVNRYRTLVVRIANALAKSYGPTASQVGWPEYLASKNKTLARLDEAIFEWAHFVAGLAAVDGAVVMSTSFELIGFGGDISGKIENVLDIYKALDPEGQSVIREPTGHFGSRHNSTYRLVKTMQDAVALIVSQDGPVQVVRRNNGNIVIWDQVASSIMDF